MSFSPSPDPPLVYAPEADAEEEAPDAADVGDEQIQVEVGQLPIDKFFFAKW